jgi:hypothetical protein
VEPLDFSASQIRDSNEARVKCSRVCGSRLKQNEKPARLSRVFRLEDHRNSGNLELLNHSVNKVWLAIL